MLKNLHFDQTKKYERSIAANEIAKMLVAFIQGREHSLSIGAEQGGIDRWDDFVIEEANGIYKHLQVKREKDHFSDALCVRDKYFQGQRKGQLRDLSPLDQCMKSLADWVKQNDPNSSSPKRRFIIVLPDNTTYIKKEIQVRHFHDLCQADIRSVTTTKGLEALANKCPNRKSCFEWLTTWCGFSDSDQILKALRLLEIKLSGNENDIDRETETILGDVFCKPSEVRGKIISYIDDNITFTGAITPRPLLKQLKEYLLPNITTWTQYQKRGSIWKISGTHDLECKEVERAAFVVPSLWNNERVRHLKFDVPVDDSTQLSKNILQLALHLQGQVNAHFTDLSGWRQRIKSLIGGTLGVGRDDCKTLSLTENSVPLSASDSKDLDKRDEFEGRAVDLKNEMIKVTWEMVVGQLEQRLDELQQTELRTTIEARWKTWRTELEQNRSKQEKLFYEKLDTLFHKILYPKAEGNDISADLRVGPKTASLIADGIFMHLIVSIGLENIGEELSVNTIGLSYWSGPSGSPRRVRELCDDGIETLIGKEFSDVLILSKASDNPSDIYKISLAARSHDEETLASSHRPKILITNNIIFKRLIKQGDLNELKNYLTKALREKLASREQSIQEAF